MMDERLSRGDFPFRVVRLQPWKVWALAAVGGALALAVMVAVAGLFLILVPVVLIGGLVAKLLLGGTGGRQPPRRSATGAEVIEGRYEVVDVRREPEGP
jgi:hypothetical protein